MVCSWRRTPKLYCIRACDLAFVLVDCSVPDWLCTRARGVAAVPTSEPERERETGPGGQTGTVSLAVLVAGCVAAGTPLSTLSVACNAGASCSAGAMLALEGDPSKGFDSCALVDGLPTGCVAASDGGSPAPSCDKGAAELDGVTVGALTTGSCCAMMPESVLRSFDSNVDVENTSSVAHVETPMPITLP